MSERNIELHRRALEAFNARDIDALLTQFDPSIEFHSVLAAVGGETYRGHDEIRRWHRDLEDAWKGEYWGEPEAFFDLGEQSLLFHVIHGRGRQSGAAVAMPGAQVARWRDGLCIYFKAYADRAEALVDLGVSEDALEPIAP